MADRPIIFSGPMVRALLEGRKTQTRRVLNPQPVQNEAGLWVHPPKWTAKAVKKWGGACQTDDDGLRHHLAMKGPPYAPGDRLYVREAWCGHLGPILDGVRQPTIHYHGGERVLSFYKADEESLPFTHSKWRPSIHMPRWASRITLTVTEVRVQRLQEISEADAISEGATPVMVGEGVGPGGIPFSEWSWRDGFRDLWNSLHGPHAWDANPWVAAVSFTVRKGNIDQETTR